MRVITCCCAAFLWFGLVAPEAALGQVIPAQAAEQEAPETEIEVTLPPAFKTLRFEEDWSEFDPETSDAWYAKLKHIKLNQDGSIWMSLGASMRVRGEYWNNFGFSDGPDTEDFFALGRLFPYVDVHFGESFRVYLEGKTAFSSDRDLPGGRRTLDVDIADVQNFFADMRLHKTDEQELIGRVGRQELLYGRQRLVSPLPWGNTKRSWDGGRIISRTENWRIDAFFTRFAAVDKYEFNDWATGPNFFGVYATGKVGDERQFEWDLYWLGIGDNDASYNGSSGDEQRQTIGSRFSGMVGQSGVDFDMEGSYQFGEVGDADVNAWAFAIDLGYAFKNTEWTPRVFVGFDSASGDSEPDDGKVETFNQLFPLGHAYLGYMDFVGRQNILDLSTGVSAKPTDALTLRAALHLFWRVSDDDALYNAGGGVVRAGTGSNALEVGQEIDFTAQYRLNRNSVVEAGYSHFFAGSFIEDTGTSEDMDWVYAQISYVF
jgi:hypothetical protein